MDVLLSTGGPCTLTSGAYRKLWGARVFDHAQLGTLNSMEMSSTWAMVQVLQQTHLPTGGTPAMSLHTHTLYGHVLRPTAPVEQQDLTAFSQQAQPSQKLDGAKDRRW